MIICSLVAIYFLGNNYMYNCYITLPIVMFRTMFNAYEMNKLSPYGAVEFSFLFVMF